MLTHDSCLHVQSEKADVLLQIERYKVDAVQQGANMAELRRQLIELVGWVGVDEDVVVVVDAVHILIWCSKFQSIPVSSNAKANAKAKADAHSNVKAHCNDNVNGNDDDNH